MSWVRSRKNLIRLIPSDGISALLLHGHIGWLIFGFGLFHSLGFASVLAELEIVPLVAGNREPADRRIRAVGDPGEVTMIHAAEVGQAVLGADAEGREVAEMRIRTLAPVLHRNRQYAGRREIVEGQVIVDGGAPGVGVGSEVG